ncbi:MAG: hypothetical protein V2I56_03250 [Desulfobacteraceae bacterium]|jgi:hypothetical protein|nr:hypothetical protein [Desulfobacteraceae bacterium]
MAGLKLYILLLAVLATGCASVTEMKQMDKFEQTSHAYELAIRWSDFDMASSFLKNQEDPELAAQIEHLKQYQVTAYEVKRFLPAADKSQVLIFADVQYFKRDGLIVKSYSHRQLWQFDEDKEGWYLTSGLPGFK